MLCARDVVAADTVRDWIDRATRAGSPEAKTGDALLDSVAMDAWREEHGGGKVPGR